MATPARGDRVLVGNRDTRRKRNGRDGEHDTDHLAISLQ
jgi:hypothetical protein